MIENTKTQKFKIDGAAVLTQDEGKSDLRKSFVLGTSTAYFAPIPGNEKIREMNWNERRKKKNEANANCALCHSASTQNSLAV